MTDVTATPDAPKKVTIISSAVANLKYPRVLGMRTPGGSPIRDCGDKVAVALRGTGMDDWMQIAERNNIRANLQNLIDIGKNVGQVRMALGRMLRARLINFERDPEHNAEPYLPEPRPMPVKTSGPPDKPQPVPTEEEVAELDEEDEEEEDEEEDSEKTSQG